jgi:hypothetical protein
MEAYVACIAPSDFAGKRTQKAAQRVIPTIVTTAHIGVGPT